MRLVHWGLALGLKLSLSPRGGGGIKLEYSFRLGFRVSNNEDEYKALLARLRAAMDLGA